MGNLRAETLVAEDDIVDNNSIAVKVPTLGTNTFET